jgi:Fungal kinase associated-1 domain
VFQDASEPRNLLQRLFRFRPTIHYIALHGVSRGNCLLHIQTILSQNANRGISEIDWPCGIEISARVTRRNAYKVRPCKFVIEVFGIAKDGNDDGQHCVVRITQKQGSGKSVTKVFNELKKAFEITKKQWLITDPVEEKGVIDAAKV